MKIAFVGASGYGNVGDNTYPLIYSRHLSEHELLIYNSDLPEEMPADLDLVVMGGGGILYNNPKGEDPSAPSPHFAKMEHYMKWAIGAGVPYGFSSCGFQFRPDHEAGFRDSLKPWVPYFEQADFITLRSPKCVSLMRDLVGRDIARWYPDTGYLMPGLVDETPAQGSGGLTIVVAGRVSPSDPMSKRFVEFFSSMKYETTWLSMGARVDDEAQLSFARRRYPGTKVMESLTPHEAYLQIARSKLVLTGRFHGMVFARVSGVPFYYPEVVPYKLQAEDLSVPPSHAMGHITVIREALAKLGGAKSTGRAMPAACPDPVP
ncbi:polysaccharide pyruvyl transferase [Roseimicrobium gellanilyticum]|uniref:Polysaccharide pyruvyl transferase n=1 Tax=Roseimicrobium gellanilyticum TaxID=748857 RepID=A0A366HCJ9_9BACT|nr:polysaccharide pyruvyl transferase family protein [Roseimicrobium gellanilyticum]RBP39700.1 polysaccharide pyruvyl transferase [Roseimicrobium gellanilyticum]